MLSYFKKTKAKAKKKEEKVSFKSIQFTFCISEIFSLPNIDANKRQYSGFSNPLCVSSSPPKLDSYILKATTLHVVN